LVLGDALKNVASFPEARTVAQQSLDLYCELGQHTYATEAHSLLAAIDMHRGCYEQARELARTSLALARTQGPPYCVGLNLFLLGCLDLAEGAPARANQRLQDSVTTYQEVRGDRGDLSLALAGLAVSAVRLSDPQRGRQHLRHALEIPQETEAVLPRWWALTANALLLAEEGDNERAVELYALASRYPLVAESRWFEDVAGSQITALAASFPEAAATAARERGQARDLEATVEELLSELGA
jgi:tetratricopeptide (TPR) repeat protein